MRCDSSKKSMPQHEHGSTTIYHPNDQDVLDAMQRESLHRGYEGMNHYFLYNQTFIVVHGFIASPEFQVDVYLVLDC